MELLLDPKRVGWLVQMMVNRGGSYRRNAPREERFRWLVRGVRETSEGLVADCQENPLWKPAVVRPRVSSEAWRRNFRVSVEEELSLFPEGLTKNVLHRRVGGERMTFYRELGRLIEEGAVGMRKGDRRAHIVFLNNGGE